MRHDICLPMAIITIKSHFVVMFSRVPRLVHRLDKDTSGVLFVARSADAAAWLSEAFRKDAEAANGLPGGLCPGHKSA